MKVGRLKTPLILFLACLPCCLPLLGFGGTAVLATAGGVLALRGVTLLGLAILAAAALVFVVIAAESGGERQAQTVTFFEMEPDESGSAQFR
jgi:hypothetical protein